MRASLISCQAKVGCWTWRFLFFLVCLSSLRLAKVQVIRCKSLNAIVLKFWLTLKSRASICLRPHVVASKSHKCEIINYRLSGNYSHGTETCKIDFNPSQLRWYSTNNQLQHAIRTAQQFWFQNWGWNCKMAQKCMSYGTKNWTWFEIQIAEFFEPYM